LRGRRVGGAGVVDYTVVEAAGYAPGSGVLGYEALRTYPNPPLYW